jgi:hypothetical protein
MRNLNWFQGRDLAKTGSRIRREAWRKWLDYTKALWFIDELLDGRHCVINADFKRAEFLALDWTDEPWDTATDGNFDPTVFMPDGGYSNNGGLPGSGGVPDGIPGGGGGSGGGWGAAGGNNPPPGGGGGGAAQAIPAGDGGAGTANVAITGEFIYNTGIEMPDECVLTAPTVTSLLVTMSIAGGPPGIGDYSITIGGTTKIGTAYPGMIKVEEFTGITFVSGGTISVTASYNQPDSVTVHPVPNPTVFTMIQLCSDMAGSVTA